MLGLRLQLSRPRVKSGFSARAVARPSARHRLRVMVWFMTSDRARATSRMVLSVMLG